MATIRCRVDSFTPYLLFSARDTTLGATPAIRATSLMVAIAPRTRLRQRLSNHVCTVRVLNPSDQWRTNTTTFLTQLKAGLRPPRHPNGWDGPVDALDADLLQEGVGPRKRPAAEQARVRRIRARMRRLDHQVAAGVDHGLLLLGVAAPQDEDQRPFPLVQQLDDAVGEPLPALAPVGV